MQQQLLSAIHRREGARILAGLFRRFRDLEAAEDALQEAYVRAMKRWPEEGTPNSPAAWLTTVAGRILLDRLRQSGREASVDPAELERISDLSIQQHLDAASLDRSTERFGDDLLCLIFMCCHPSLAPSAQMALSLRCLCRLSTQEIARAFIEPEATTAQKLVRARKKIREARIPFGIPDGSELPGRIGTVLGVIYLLFNEGFSATSHDRLGRPDLIHEALHLSRTLTDLLPGEPEVLGLQALLLLHAARLPAREDSEGGLIPLDEQDRRLWLQANIREGKAQLSKAMGMRRPGPYQIQAAIAALHADASSASSTDWTQIHALYGALIKQIDSPVIRLNRAMALSMTGDLDGAHQEVETLAASGTLNDYQPLAAARADLARRRGDADSAATHYRCAIELAGNEGERRFLQRRLALVLRN